jgi:hypothetical protein
MWRESKAAEEKVKGELEGWTVRGVEEEEEEEGRKWLWELRSVRPSSLSFSSPLVLTSFTHHSSSLTLPPPSPPILAHPPSPPLSSRPNAFFRFFFSFFVPLFVVHPNTRFLFRKPHLVLPPLPAYRSAFLVVDCNFALPFLPSRPRFDESRAWRTLQICFYKLCACSMRSACGRTRAWRPVRGGPDEEMKKGLREQKGAASR